MPPWLFELIALQKSPLIARYFSPFFLQPFALHLQDFIHFFLPHPYSDCLLLHSNTCNLKTKINFQGIL